MSCIQTQAPVPLFMMDEILSSIKNAIEKGESVVLFITNNDSLVEKYRNLETVEDIVDNHFITEFDNLTMIKYVTMKECNASLH